MQAEVQFPNNWRVGESTVQKVSPCAGQIHYHIVFPVTYRKALLEDDAVAIIMEGTRDLAERDDLELERLGCALNHIRLRCSAHIENIPVVLPRGYLLRAGRGMQHPS